MEFPKWVEDRVIARQGRLHPYDELPAALRHMESGQHFGKICIAAKRQAL